MTDLSIRLFNEATRSQYLDGRSSLKLRLDAQLLDLPMANRLRNNLYLMLKINLGSTMKEHIEDVR